MSLDEERRRARERKLANQPSWDLLKPAPSNSTSRGSAALAAAGSRPAASAAYVPPALRGGAQPSQLPGSWDDHEPIGSAQAPGSRDARMPPRDGAADARAPRPAPPSAPPPPSRDEDAHAANAIADHGSRPHPRSTERAPEGCAAAPGSTAAEEFGHVLEVCGLPSALPQPQLISLVASLVQLEAESFTLVPVSARASLLVLHSTAAASAALHANEARGAGAVRLLPLSGASDEARRFASTQPLPKAHRPRTTAAGASRLISSSLGIRAPGGAARAGPTLAEERQRREDERARKEREKAEADALWFDE